MQLINSSPPVKVQLSRNLVKVIKRGHAWVYADALRTIPDVPPGTPAILLDNRGGREIGRGYLDPSGPIALRVCSTQPNHPLTSAWAEATMHQALALRTSLFSPYTETNAFRLFNGEGDGLPGLVCDIYADAAVLVTDGPAPENFWRVQEIAHWLTAHLLVSRVFHKSRGSQTAQTTQILGDQSEPTTYFLENGITFTANPLDGQKTGFFLDQRDNRKAIQPLSRGKRVLNVFGYTGGFSVYAGIGGADQVATVDIAEPALEEANLHWTYNQLQPEKHNAINADAFIYLSEIAQKKEVWDIVILDPPSFAPSEASLPQAVKAYTRLISLGVQVTAPGGILAAASCSSHLRSEQFNQIMEESIAAGRRKGTTLGFYGQPPDHPSPLAMPELRYLKFSLVQLD